MMHAAQCLCITAAFTLTPFLFPFSVHTSVIFCSMTDKLTIKTLERISRFLSAHVF